MKKIILISLLMVFTFSLSFGQKNNISVIRKYGKTTLSIQDSKKKLKLKVKGKVTFTDDDRGIKSLSPDGSISYKKGKKKLKIFSEQKGSLLYVINGAKKAVPDAKDETLIAEAVQTMINMGVNGKERAQRIYKETGFDGVLKEVDRFDSDYVKSIYLGALGAQHSLSDKEMITFLNKAETRLSSDYYKAELLKGIRENYLRNEATTEAYLNAIKSIKSDYYQVETLKKLWKTSPTEKQAEQVLEIVKNVDSDYYQAEIITALLKSKSIEEKSYSQILAAIQEVNSSYYQAEILKNLITNQVKDEQEWSRIIAYTQKIDSDYYKAEVLKKIAKNMPTSDTLKKEFEEAAKTIHSDLYYGSVIRKVHDR